MRQDHKHKAYFNILRAAFSDKNTEDIEPSIFLEKDMLNHFLVYKPRCWNSFIVAIAGIIILCTMLACVPFGDAWISFSGRIYDNMNNPIEDAQLKLLFNGKARSDRSRITSNSSGEYNVFENSCPCEFDFEIIVTKEGFKPYHKKISGREAYKLSKLDIVMERDYSTQYDGTKR